MTGARGRMDRVNDDPGPFQQGVNGGALAGFDGNGDRSATAALFQLIEPLMKIFGGMIQRGGFGGAEPQICRARA